MVFDLLILLYITSIIIVLIIAFLFFSLNLFTSLVVQVTKMAGKKMQDLSEKWEKIVAEKRVNGKSDRKALQPTQYSAWGGRYC